jgi:hypothetical protein
LREKLRVVGQSGGMDASFPGLNAGVRLKDITTIIPGLSM